MRGSIIAWPSYTNYSATKGAITAFTKALAQSLIACQIRVNAVAPGPVWTPLNPADAGSSAEEVANFGKKTPMGRPAQPEELAPAYVFLASNALDQGCGGRCQGGLRGPCRFAVGAAQAPGDFDLEIGCARKSEQ